MKHSCFQIDDCLQGRPQDVPQDVPQEKCTEKGPSSPEKGLSSQKSGLKNEKWPEKCLQMLQMIQLNPDVTISELEKQLAIGHTTIKKMLKGLQTEGLLRRIGPDNGGLWKIVSPEQKAESNELMGTISKNMKEMGL